MLKYKKIFDFGFNVNNPYHNTVKIVYISNIIISFYLVFLAILNILYFSATTGLVELGISIVLMVIIYQYKIYANEKAFLLLTTLFIFAVSLIYFIYNTNNIFALAWVFFFPLVAYMLNGIAVGSVISVLYIIIIAIYLYSLVNVDISMEHFLNVFSALVAFGFLAFLNEYSKKESYIQVITLIDTLENMSKLDELTKLNNRRFLNEEILNNKDLKNKPFVFCIADIDNFKAYNDYYGHQKGDEALRKIASIKEKIFGHEKNHYVIRLGGEEFGIFLFDTKNPQKYFDKFLEEIKKVAIEHKKNPPYYICTVSMGVVICDANINMEFSKIYQIADKALYEAKNTGKNKIIYKKI
jgi:diguanylate cyclase (GGDEF)-like protein